MKRLLVFSVLLLIYGHGWAQIIWESDDLLETAKTYPIRQIPDSAWDLMYSMELGDAGADRLYDFRLLDSVPTEREEFRVTDPAKRGWGGAFPKANAMVFDFGYFNFSRDPIQYQTQDFPVKDDRIEYVSLDTDDWAWYFFEQYLLSFKKEGADRTYKIKNYGVPHKDTTEVHFLDPKTTPWKDDFPHAQMGRVTFEHKRVNGDLEYRIYEFYLRPQSELIKVGIGAQIDKGLLTTGAPNGEYVEVPAEVSNKHVVNYEILEMGKHYSDESHWQAETTQGFTTLKHYDHTVDTFRVTGHGTLYLPQDSFQVYQIQRHVDRYWIDSILTPFGEQVLVDSESVFTYEFYAKGYGLPIAVLRVDSGGEGEVTEVKHITTFNRHPFHPLIIDTVVGFYDLLDVQESSIQTLGKSIILDTAVYGYGNGPSRIFDTLNCPFNKPQFHSSIDFAYGFGHTDTATYEFQINDGFRDTTDIEKTLYRQTIVDGYGTLLMGEDTVEVLRVWIIKREATLETQYYKDEVRHYDDSTNYYELHYLAKGFGHPVVRIEFYEDDSTDIRRVTFMDLSPDIPTAEGKPESDGRLQVYPNPATNRVYIQLPIADGNYELGIYDLKGSLVRSATGAEQLVFDVGGFEKGVYMVRATHLSSGTVAIAKLVVR